MSHDALLRSAAVVAAIAILAAPYWGSVRGWLASAATAAYARRAVAGRIAAAGLLIAAAWGKVSLPTLPSVAPQVTVDTPSDELQRLVTPVAEALAGLPAADRALWADLWTKVGIVAAGDAVSTTTVFADTRALRDSTALAVEIGWRRIGKHAPGSQESLRKAVESAYGSAVGSDVVSVTSDVRARYVALANALAWAATR